MKRTIVALLLSALIFSLFWWFKDVLPGTPLTPHATFVPAPDTVALVLKPPRTPPQGMSEYRDEKYGFQMFVPDDMQITAFKEAGDATTFTFTSGEKIFQLFVTPYGEKKIAEAKFKEDIPSGVIQNVTTGVIDGSDTAFFDSTQAGLGDTREVWFVGKGLLFEFTTYRNLGSWMEPIVKTLEFL